MSLADLDTSPLQAKAGQTEMDIAYDMTQGDSDLTAAQTYNQTQAGQGILSIQLNPALKFAQFTLIVPTKAITKLTTEQLKAQDNALTLWANLFRFKPETSCQLQRYEVKSLTSNKSSPPPSQPLAETSLNWLLTCPELKAAATIEIGGFTALAPNLHTMRVDWLTPTSLGLQTSNLPMIINPHQTDLK